MDERAELILLGDTSQLGDALDASESKLEDFWANVERIMQGVANTIGDIVAKAVTEGLNKLTDSINDTLKEVSSQFDETLRDVSGNFKGTFETIEKRAKTFKEALIDITGWTAIVAAAVRPVVEVFLAPFKLILSALTKTVSIITGLFVGLVKAITSLFIALASTVIGAVTGLLKGITTAIGATLSSILKLASEVASKILSVISAALSTMPLLVVGVSEGLRAGFSSLLEFEAIATRVGALVKSTGVMAGFSAKQLDDMAQALRRVSTFGSDATKSAQAMMLQFVNVRGDVFEDALKVAADLATVMGVDLPSAANQLGQALNNPIEGVKALRDMGLLLWDQEKALIESLVMTGRVAEAQYFILRKLAGHVGGAAAEAAKTFSGQVAQVNNALQGMWRSIADTLTPALSRLLPYFTESSDRVAELAKRFKDLVEELMVWAEDSMPVITAWFQNLLEIASVAFKQAADYAIRAYTLFETAWENAPAVFDEVERAARVMMQKLKVFMLEVWDGFFPVLETAWDKIASFAKRVMLDALKPVADTIDALLSMMPGVTSTLAKDWLDAERKGAALDEKLVGARAKDREMQRARDGEPEALKKAREVLENLEAAAADAESPFWKNFDANLEKNKEAVSSFTEWATKQLEKLLKEPEEPEARRRGNRGRPGMPYVIEPGRTAGNFEGLEDLNRRIQSAAAKSPEIILLQQQNDMMRSHYADQKKLGQRQAEGAEGAAAAGQSVANALAGGVVAVYS